MGLTYVTVKLRPLAGSKRGIEESFLVDTGAVDCLVAESKLRKLGIKAEGKDVYELADGTTVELPFGFARVSFLGRRRSRRSRSVQVTPSRSWVSRRSRAPASASTR